MEGGKGGVLDVKSLYVLPNGASCRPAAHRSLMRVVVNQSSLHRSASSALASTSRDFPDGWRWPRTRFIGFVRGAQICMVCVHHWRQVKGICRRRYYCLVILDGSVQCQLLRNRAPSPRFLSPYLLGFRWSFLPSRTWAGSRTS